MGDNSKWLKKGLGDLVRIRDSYEDRSKMYRMDRNERTWSIPDDILDDIRKRTDSDILTNYTEIEGTYHRIAEFLGVRYEQIYLHSGSDLVIKSIFETYVDRDDIVLIQNPSYAMYGVYARMYGADLREADYDETLSFDLNRYCELIKKLNPKMVVLENPGGYVGNSFSHEEVKRFVEVSAKNGALAVVDEAYIDFIPQSSVTDIVDEFDNLIVVRTFSKAWGLAGLRAGYAVSNDQIISEMFKVRPMHEITSFTAMVVETMLDHPDETKSFVDDVIKVREYFCSELDQLNIKFTNSSAHFVTVCIGDKMNTEDFRIKAHNNRFFVRRPFGQPMLKDWVRIGLLPMDDMRSFVAFLKKYLQENSCAE